MPNYNTNSEKIDEIDKIVAAIISDNGNDRPVIDDLQEINDYDGLINKIKTLSNAKDDEDQDKHQKRRLAIHLLQVQALRLYCDAQMQKASEQNKKILQALKNTLEISESKRPLVSIINFSDLLKQEATKANQKNHVWWRKILSGILLILNFIFRSDLSSNEATLLNIFKELREILSFTKLKTLNTLYLHSSGGSGHTVAKEALFEVDLEEDLTAIKSESLSEEPLTPAQITALKKTLKALQQEKNMLGDWVPIGSELARSFNYLQKNKAVFLKLIVDMQGSSEMASSRSVYKKIYNYLARHPEINKIVDTQPLHTRILTQAVADINQKKSRQIHIHKHMTDLPSKGSNHFFKSFSSLNDLQKEQITLHTYEPLVENPQKKEDFFEAVLPSGMTYIIEETFPVRSDFQASSLNNSVPDALTLPIHSEEEKALIQRLSSNQTSQVIIQGESNNTFEINTKKTRIATMMFGSQGNKHLPKLVKAFMDKAKHTQEKIILIVFCNNIQKSDGSLEPTSLYQKIVSMIDKQNTENVLLLPVGRVNAKMLANTLKKSSWHFSAAGGISTMEISNVMKINQKMKCFVVTDTKENTFLLDWEAGNAQFLRRKYPERVELVSIKDFGDKLDESDFSHQAKSAVKPR